MKALLIIAIVLYALAILVFIAYGAVVSLHLVPTDGDDTKEYGTFAIFILLSPIGGLIMLFLGIYLMFAYPTWKILLKMGIVED